MTLRKFAFMMLLAAAAVALPRAGSAALDDCYNNYQVCLEECDPCDSVCAHGCLQDYRACENGGGGG